MDLEAYVVHELFMNSQVYRKTIYKVKVYF